MTRINLVPPSELADQHLFAEFREMKMVPKSLARSIEAEARQVRRLGMYTDLDVRISAIRYLLQRLPKEYTLGAGHVSFFYDKAYSLSKRYVAICVELRRRGVAFNADAKLDADRVWSDDPELKLMNDYTPTPEALALNRARIAERIAMKPEWYRWTEAAA